MHPYLQPLTAPIASLQQLIERFDHQGMIIGGVAISLLSEPRLTADADAVLLVDTDNLPLLLDVAQQVGLEPRIDDVISFAQRSRVVLLKHMETGISVDISLGLLPFEVEAIERSKLHPVGNLLVRIPTVEDLIILKAVAHRPKDMLDIASLIAAQPNLDIDHIAFWVKQFAEVLETPEVWTELKALLRQVT